MIVHFDMQALLGIRSTRGSYRQRVGEGFVRILKPVHLSKLFILLTVFSGAAAGCHASCPKHADALGPLITAYAFKQQFPSDPYTAVFGFTFQSQSSSISNGTAEFYVGSSSTPVKVKMWELMSASGLKRSDRTGELGAALRFSKDNISNGQPVDMLLQLVDETGLRSNCARVTLQFTFAN